MFLFVVCQFLLRQIYGIPHSKCIHYSHVVINNHVIADFMLHRVKIHCVQPWISLPFNWHMHVCVSNWDSLCCKSKLLPLSRLFARPTPGLLYIARGAAGVILIWLGGVVHLSNDLSEQFVYHSFALGWSLHKRAAPLLGQGLPFVGRYLPLTFQVHLVPHQDHRNLLIPTDRHRPTWSYQKQMLTLAACEILYLMALLNYIKSINFS